LRTSFSLLLTILLLLSLLSCVTAKTSLNIEGHWAEQTLQKWIDNNWIPSVTDGDGDVRPNDNVTRAEFTSFVNHAFQYTHAAESLPFKDLTVDHWAYKHIAIAFKAGYLKGDSSNHVYPDQPISRQEVAVILNQILKLESKQEINLSKFTDNKDIASWAKLAVSNLGDSLILKGDPNGKFRPVAFMTRAEAIVAMEAASMYTPNNQQQPHENLDTNTSRLKVSNNGRFLTRADSTPFFWLGDTAWELAHRLNRSEVRSYIQSAHDQGISVIHFVALTPLDGLTEPNALGDLPLHDKNPTSPIVTPGSNPNVSLEYDYWDHVDYIIDTAGSLGIYVALHPSWGVYLWENRGQKADPIFDATNAAQYGEWLGHRYADKDNIIWILGGDRIPDTDEKMTLIRNMAKGLDAGGGTQIKTYHPWGGKSSSEYFHEDAWLDFNSFQSGHPSRDYKNYKFTRTDYARKIIKPTIDIEPRYENHPINFNLENGRFDGYDARQAAYWSLFAGAFGHTYGHNSIWQMYEADKNPKADASNYWTKAIHDEGRTTMKWLKALIEARPMLDRIPDQSLIVDELSNGNIIKGTRGNDYAFIYSSTGESFTVNMGMISGDTVTAYWYDPRMGESKLIDNYPNKDQRAFTPPSNGRGHDWVLVLDDKSKNYPSPSIHVTIEK